MDTNSENSFTNLPIHTETFKNRKREFKDATFQLLERRVPTLMFWGEAGVGKTSLALHLAHELIREDLYHSIVWTTAKAFELGIANPINRNFFKKPFNQYSQRRRRQNEGVFVESLLDLYQTIILNSGYYDEHDEYELDDVWHDEELLEPRVLAWLKARRILLFLDDIDSWKKTDWRYVLKFIGKISFPSAAVITSRRNIDPVLIGSVAPIRVGPLDEVTMRELLEGYVSTYRLKIDSKDKLDIFNFSVGNPLILNLILGTIKIRSTTFWGNAAKISHQILDEIESSIYSSKPIEEFLFQDLFEHITKESQKVMLAIATLKKNRKQVSMKAIDEITSLGSDKIQKSLDELQSVSLINRLRIDKDNYDVHPLFVNYLVSTSQ